MSDREIGAFDAQLLWKLQRLNLTAEFTKWLRKDLAALTRELRSRMTTSEHTVAKQLILTMLKMLFTGPTMKDMPVASAGCNLRVFHHGPVEQTA